MDKLELWERFRHHLCEVPAIGLALDISRMNFPEGFLQRMEPAIQKAFDAMERLEAGEIANPDENRMVGHYWLRAPALAPDLALATEIKFTIQAIKDFSSDIHEGGIISPTRRRFTRLLVIGIGGSALGPQFVSDALGSANDPIEPHFFDNTDPDGMDRVLARIGNALAETLVIVISKSGGTKETRNGMLEAKAAYERSGLEFARHAVAVTGRGSELDRTAEQEGWLARFPMWDWVGGRTSETSTVGLVAAALQGLDIDTMLEGARLCDEVTRNRETARNPAALLALMWHYATNGRGERDMVVIPYKDRLAFFSRYLQQLIMESIGKERDLDSRTVNQGLTVYGNKGSTDQHAYVQQLREGVNNFFVTFIEVLKDREGNSTEVEPGITSGDYLSGFYLGTRQALHENGRESMTLTVERIDPRTIGVLIALFERTVGLYASLVNINAYHQPGVEAGKKAAAEIVKLQREILAALRREKGRSFTCEEIAEALGRKDDVELVIQVLRHAAANEDHGVSGDSSTSLERKYKAIR